VCFACHETDYNETNDPNHAIANFPTDCESCHSVNGWEPADWDHDGQYFPIYSGSHNGKWDECGECHTIPTDYTFFDCTNCHEHNQAETDSKHNEVNDYVYASAACYSCHPRGQGD
jgi:hypothetical protein